MKRVEPLPLKFLVCECIGNNIYSNMRDYLQGRQISVGHREYGRHPTLGISFIIQTEIFPVKNRYEYLAKNASQMLFDYHYQHGNIWESELKLLELIAQYEGKRYKVFSGRYQLSTHRQKNWFMSQAVAPIVLERGIKNLLRSLGSVQQIKNWHRIVSSPSCWERSSLTWI